ncbi:protein kinase [Cystobacter fuscus]|uniref:protein kinase domain-containing protein n=1 Tax=Cystobacter fuscus TaxID=43 RepID=UPI002B2934ED|nr:protein kinase [Cystobacter fuscus]
MNSVRYHSLGPLLSGEGSRAFLGLALEEGQAPRPVVLVWAPPDVARDAELSVQLKRETQRASALEHPNILRVHGLAQLEPGLARITEFANGESLRRVLEVRPRIPPAFAALIASDVAMGLHYAHLAGNDDGTPLVHGDVRPETVMVSFNGVCKVTGYGALSVAPRERTGRRVRNRRNYSAPEQLNGGRGAMTPSTDVFLLGLLLHECLSGHMPFHDAPDGDQAVLTAQLPALPNDVPRALAAVVTRATAKRVHERYANALEFREALVAAVDGVIPPASVFAEFLTQLFPPDRDARATRHQMLEMGLAEVGRRASPVSSGAMPAVTAPPRRPSGAMVAPLPPADPDIAVDVSTDFVDVPFENEDADAVDSVLEITGRHARPGVARPLPREEPEPAPVRPRQRPPSPAPKQEQAAPAPAPREPRSHLPLIAGALAIAAVVVAAGGVFVWSTRERVPPTAPKAPPVATAEPSAQPLPQAEPPPEATAQAPAPDAPSDAVQAVATAPDTEAPATSDSVVLAAGTLPSPPAPGDAEAPTDESAPVTTRLQLFVLPEVEVSLGGKPLGHTPLTVPLPPGTHTLELSIPAKGVRTTRTLTVKPQGVTTERFLLGRGSVQVNAPPGAVILLDGHKAGRKLSPWEGEHQLVVTSGEGRWEKTFQLESSQQLTFDATPTPP